MKKKIYIYIYREREILYKQTTERQKEKEFEMLPEGMKTQVTKWGTPFK
jgi:hypothetical protein